MSKSYQIELLNALSPPAKFLGFGEVVHGSRTLHEEMLGTAKFLIQTLAGTPSSIRWLGFEIPASTGVALNRACHSESREDVASAVPKLYRIFQSPEYESFFGWLREENGRRKKAGKTTIEIYGFDIRDPFIQKDSLLRYLDDRGIKLSEQADRTLRKLDQREFYRAESEFYEGGAGEDDKRIYHELIEQLTTLTDLPMELQQAHELLVSGLSYFVKSDGKYFEANQIRDAAMAANVVRKSEEIPGNALLFGHFYHMGELVNDRQIPGVTYKNPKGMGEVLKEKFGADYAAVAFTFCEGEYARTEADIVGVKANPASMESAIASITPKQLPAYIPSKDIPPHFELGHFDVIDGTDVDDSRDPKIGPVSEMFRGVVVCTKSKAVQITRREH